MNAEKDTVDMSKAIDELCNYVASSPDPADSTTTAVMGSCTFVSGGKVHCLNVTKDLCGRMGGTFTSPPTCAPKPGPGQCQAQ